MTKNENGFTLLESLFVLSIFLLLTSLSLLFLSPNHTSLEKQLFFSQLKADLFLAQQYAITNQEVVLVNFDPENHFYYVKKTNGKTLIKKEFSEKITVSEGSLKLNFRFSSSGNISSFGSIYIYIEKERYRMTFLIGEGRFYVVKV
jgi:competence protein ComGD